MRASVYSYVGARQLVRVFSQRLLEDLGHQQHPATSWGHVGVPHYLGPLHGALHYKGHMQVFNEKEACAVFAQKA